MNKPKKASKIITPPKVLTSGFVLLIAVGTLLLSLPSASAGPERIPLLDALFMSTSASCVTGLSVIDAGTQLSLMGQIVLLTLSQIGGIGFMTVGTLIALAFNRRISLREKLILQEAMNHNTMEGLISLIRRVLIYSVIIETLGAVILAFRFSYDMPLGEAAYFGVFHSISYFNNAGFDLFGQISGPFSGLNNYVSDVTVNFTVMFLIFLGGLGFIVIYDLLEYPKTRRLSFHSKIVLTFSGVLFLAGALLIYLLERSNPATFGPLDEGSRIMAGLFHSISARSGGASTVNLGDMNHSSQFLIMVLMFIGAAPGSTGGGIKVTVFAVLVGAVYTMIRGREEIVFFRKRLSKDSIFKAITQTWLALFLVISTGMVLSALEDREFLNILFETVSAFGTTGSSLGITPQLTGLGKGILCIIMFLGRVGPLTLAYALAPKSNKQLYQHPEGKIIIG
ncbi:Trk family potassium uptake protein [Paenibacillus sp. CAA11]|uniref:TrkH family potassium uptake protein n=1 Tax=Paenibacillus sp. CAA11 TaxID=1532905 RepID=UPI000D342D49|nr:potassium transporter TrkG [Paenibacillus sp. CAA11]AWB46888.1 Trk family potassium uptake protein [Paenibacillus sp. CAA11]